MKKLKRNADGGVISNGLFIAIAVIATIIVIGVVIYFVNSSKNSATKAGTQFNDIADTYGQQYKSYDGAYVSGYEVLEAIRNMDKLDTNVADTDKSKAIMVIEVKTKAGAAAISYWKKADGTVTPALKTTVTDNDYINPEGNFLGEAVKNANGYINKVIFTQK